MRSLLKLKKRGVFFFVFFLAAFSAYAGDASHGGGHDMTHRMMMLVIQLGIILFAARLGSMFFEKIKLPGVLGELTAGILIGPYLLGGISMPGFADGVFPEYTANFAVSPELYGICTVASIVLLFMVGLETDIKLFLRYSVAGSLVGIGGVTLSFILGNFAAGALMRGFFGVEANFFTPACLLLGVIATATSVGISARVLSERGKLDSAEGVTILAGAVVDDVLGIILLAISLGVISASHESGEINWGHIGIIALKAVGIWLAATMVGLLASQKIGILLKWFKDRSSIAVMALGLALILAGLFEEAKLAMIIGAYVMGLSISRTDISYVVREKIHPIHSFLVPIFFTVMGMMVDLRLLASTEVLIFGILFTVVGIAAKIVGCGIPALFCNFNVRGALRIGCGMLPRGEVTLIIAGVGLSGGFISPKIFGAVVFMTLVTTLIAPAVLISLFKNPAEGLRKKVSSPESTSLSFQFPSAQTADLLLGKLLATFESDGFFVHLLNRSRKLYQLRKDLVAISLRQKENDLVFECGQNDVALVNTSMLEVLAELERTVEELKKPVDKRAISQTMNYDSNSVGHAKTFAKYLSTKVLNPHIKGSTKEEVIDELLQMLKKSGQLKDIDEAREAVLSREASMSTGMQHGIAIPHGRTDAVKKLVCAIGIKPDGIDFDSIDGKPSTIFVLTLSPKSSVAPHVQFMSMISQALSDKKREALLACEKPREMLKLLTGRKTDMEIEALIERKSVIEMSREEAEKEAQLALYLNSNLIKLDLQGETTADVVNELLDLLVADGKLKNVRPARSAILAREKQMGSGLAHGVAIPHARTDAVDGLVCAIGIKRSGIDFGALDGQPSRIIVLTLSPENQPAPHVRFMAMLSRALDEEGRARVMESKSSEEVLAALV